LTLLIIVGTQAPSVNTNEAEMNTRSWMGSQRKEKGEWTLSNHYLYMLDVDPMGSISAYIERMAYHTCPYAEST